MIKFFRDTLDGPLYYILAVICIFFIMAIIGFLMERKKLEKERKEKTAVIDQQIPITPIEPVTVTESPTIEEQSKEEPQEFSEVKRPVIDFNESSQEK